VRVVPGALRGLMYAGPFGLYDLRPDEESHPPRSFLACRSFVVMN